MRDTGSDLRWGLFGSGAETIALVELLDMYILATSIIESVDYHRVGRLYNYVGI